MARHIASTIFAALFFTLFSCGGGETYEPGDGQEDGPTDTTDQTGDVLTDPDGADPQQDGDVQENEPACPGGQVLCSGSCVDTSSDHSNCGSCGNACAPSEACIAGHCTLQCPSGETDCSGTCVDLASDHDNCGSCGHGCSSTQVCDRGTCSLQCSTGLTDCSGSCVDLQTSHSHCGACGHDCLGAACVASACQAVQVAVPQGTSINPWNGFLALGPANVYFSYAGHDSGGGTNRGGVAMAAKDGSGASCIACDIGMPRELATDSSSVYWVDTGINELRKAPLGGGTVTTLWSGQVGSPVAVDPGHVYWFDASLDTVMQADLDGRNPTAVARGQTGVGSIAADSGFLFWTTGGNIMEMNLSGGSPTAIATGQNTPKSIAADSTHVYWITGAWTGSETVQRMPRGGGTIDILASAGAYAIALDSTHVYAADNHDGEIWRVPKAGGTVEMLATGQPNPFDIAVDNVAAYWSSETNAEVAKVAK
jgi:hypothetical protein